MELLLRLLSLRALAQRSGRDHLTIAGGKFEAIPREESARVPSFWRPLARKIGLLLLLLLVQLLPLMLKVSAHEV